MDSQVRQQLIILHDVAGHLTELTKITFTIIHRDRSIHRLRSTQKPHNRPSSVDDMSQVSFHAHHAHTLLHILHTKTHLLHTPHHLSDFSLFASFLFSSGFITFQLFHVKYPWPAAIWFWGGVHVKYSVGTVI